MPSSAPKIARAARCGETSLRSSPDACPSATTRAIASRYAVNFGAAYSFISLVDCRRMTVMTSARSRSPSSSPSCSSMMRRSFSAAPGRRGQLRLQEREQALDAVLEERDEQLVLRLEVEVDGPVGDSGGLGDLADARRVEALLREDAHGGVEDALALVAPRGPGAPQGRRRGRRALSEDSLIARGAIRRTGAVKRADVSRRGPGTSAPSAARTSAARTPRPRAPSRARAAPARR